MQAAGLRRHVPGAFLGTVKGWKHDESFLLLVYMEQRLAAAAAGVLD
jgi:hypothetical protein